MRILFDHHSGFALIADKAIVLIDILRDERSEDFSLSIKELLKLNLPIYVLATHFHEDHFDPCILSLSSLPNVKYILSSDIKKRRGKFFLENTFDLTFIRLNQVYKDDNLSIIPLDSTDSGLSFYINLEGINFFHAGDCNLWYHRDLSLNERKMMDGTFESVLKNLKALDTIDILMFPIDARFKSQRFAGIKRLCEVLIPKFIIPMHGWNLFSKMIIPKEYCQNSKILHLTHNETLFSIVRKGEEIEVVEKS